MFYVPFSIQYIGDLDIYIFDEKEIAQQLRYSVNLMDQDIMVRIE